MNHAVISIHIVPPDAPHNDACLNGEEKQRASSFHFEHDRRRWISSRASLRRILGETIGLPPAEVPLVVSPSGKPHLAEPHGYLHFNLSHCDSLAIVAVCGGHPVGIDIESRDRAPSLVECAATFLHPEEIPARGNDPHLLLETWCAKEALLKARGTGLAIDPSLIHLADDFSSILAPGEFPPYHLFRLEHPHLSGHTAFLSTTIAHPAIRFF